jgi:C4-dicarboxylate-specific signal transduction histidine kinase
MPSFRFGDVASFRYRLGNNGAWVTLGSERELRLALTEPGRTMLTVEGRVPGGEWSPAAPITFEVVPLFSEQLWPRVLVGTVLLALLLAFVRQRERTTRATARAREVELNARRDAAELAERHHREMAQVGRVAVAGELTASLSHELGQPLAAIVNNAEVARRLLQRTARADAPANPAVDEALLDVVAQGRRASEVVREFRRFLRREHGEREQVRVQELLNDAALLLRQEYAQSGIRLHVRVASQTPALVVERVLVQQVLVNLLQNAHDAARQGGGGQVLVRARPVGDGVRVTVLDDGPGFPVAVRRSAFEPFVTTRHDGMGMGLAIARRIVESHGGHIAVGRLPSAGAVVSLWLPVRHAPADTTDSLVPRQVTMHA